MAKKRKKKRGKHRKRRSRPTGNQALRMVGETTQVAIGATAAVAVAGITTSILKK